jgi:hypothetical protein
MFDVITLEGWPAWARNSGHFTVAGQANLSVRAHVEHQY